MTGFPANCLPSRSPSAGALHDLLDERASHSPNALSYRFLSDGESMEHVLTCGELARRARLTAKQLLGHGAQGKPVLLIHPPGLDFIIGLFACWYAGAIAVPAYPPRGKRHRQRLDAILSDCGAELALAPAGQAAIPGIQFVRDAVSPTEEYLAFDLPSPPHDPCLLQYTSGSTAEPKGVMISHHNLRSHFASMRICEELEFTSSVSWLPPYHDMGLVLKILYSFEAGIPLTFFSPDHFIQRPVRWLRAISRYGASLSGAPNFAYEMCLRSIRDEELEGLDLSCWKAAACGAERVRPETLERFTGRFAPYGFRPEAFMPGYGLAESTLILTASPAGKHLRFSEHPTVGKLVSSGVPLPDVSIRVADPESGRACKDREIGEILAKAPVVSSGYWNRPDATDSAFGPEDDRELRTGDLGYLEDGHLYVTGRIKDLIIIDGVNHAPEDIESIVFSSVPEVTAVAAFATEHTGREGITLTIEADGLPNESGPALCSQIRRSIVEMIELPIQQIMLVRSGLLPRTTSGKIRRSACRDSVTGDSLKFIFSDHRTAAITDELQPGVLGMVLAAVTEVTGRKGVRAEDDIIGFGMSSMEVTRLAALIESGTGLAIPHKRLFTAGSFREIATTCDHHDGKTATLPAIIPGSGRDAHLLTHSQERMWFLHQLEPQSAAYHVFGSLEMTGQLDVGAFDSAIATVISRHDILLSRHGSKNGLPQVWIDDASPPSLEILEASDEKSLQTALTRFARKPFDLAHEPAIRTCLVGCGANRHIFGISAHHIVADGSSLRILAKEISSCYHAFCSALPLPEFSQKPDYLDYAACHRQWIDSGAVDSQIGYWKSKLEGHPGVLHLATDFPRPSTPSSDGGAVEVTLPAELCNRVSALARIHRCTPFMVHLATFLLLLRRHGAGDDPVVAIPVANRNHAAAGNLVGTLVNTLPFRVSFDPTESFGTLLDRVREAAFGMQANQDAPFERIIDTVKPDRSRDHLPLAQVMFDHQEIPIAETWSGGLHCRPFIAHRGAVQFDLSLLLTVLHDRQQLSIEYRTDLFLPETAASLLDRYLTTLESICGNTGRELAGIAGLAPLDEKLLEEISQGPARPDFPQQTTPALISRRAARHPRQLAYNAGETAMDYGTLEAGSSNLASALRDQGVRPGDRVAILLERDFTLPIALLAIWKTGAAYVPLDQANPPERLRLILEDQAPLHLLVSPSLMDRVPAGSHTILLEEKMLENPGSNVRHVVSPKDPAYVIYTSGSTGRPKGVVVSHGALANFLLSMAETPGFTEDDKLLAVTTISFDISALEIFLPLVTGGNFDLIRTETARDGERLLEKLKSSRATFMQATPATWRLLIDAGWQGSPGLKILCGGEALDLSFATRLVEMGCQLWNMYGPTETTVWSTVWQVPQNPQFVRIGQPIANTGIHVLATDGSPLPPGVPGKLWISGAGLADGYWKRPDLTERSFVSSRYDTGDLAKWHADGTLECLGRSDGQVKIRGFRVELGEIEAALAAHPQVSQAKVAFRGSGPDGRKLIAWVSTSDGQTLNLGTLRDFLSERLPAYMLPTDIGVIDCFPLNSNGKVDTTRLANPTSAPEAEVAITATERQLATIWSELLDRSPVHRDDDWFHIGGHSLLALRLFARIHREFHLSLPLSAILDHSTLRSLASMIDENQPTIRLGER